MNRKTYAFILFGCVLACTLSSNLQAAPKSDAASGKIVFSRAGWKKGIHIYSVNPDGSNQTLLIKNLGVAKDFSFSPDGRSVVIAATGEKEPFKHWKELSNDIFLLTIYSKKPIRIPNNLYDYSPAFSNDGKCIVYSSGIHDEHTHQFAIWKMNSDGSHITRVNGTSNPKFFSHGTYDQTPSITPDGQKIVFSSGTSIQENNDAAYGLQMTEKDFSRQIYMIDVDGSARKALTNAPTQNYEPSVSPDEKRIAFVSERDGNPEIYVMNIDGSEQTRLTNNSGSDSQPAWSPDSTMLAWTSNNKIYVMSADGTGQKRLTKDNNGYSEMKPQWLKTIPTWKLHQNLSIVPTQIASQTTPSKPN